MAINIQSLFADIIDTPEQRQQKLLQQGMVQGQLLSSGLRGRAAALAPLAQVAGQLGVQRQEDLRRAVQPMIGIDPRTTGEKMAEQLKDLDPENPDSLLQAAQALQSIDPVRAASLRQMAAQKEIEKQQQERQKRIDDAKLKATELEIKAREGEVEDIALASRALPEIAQNFADQGYTDLAAQVRTRNITVAEANRLADARRTVEESEEWARLNDTTIFRRSDGETIETGDIPAERLLTVGTEGNQFVVGLNADGSVKFRVSYADLASGQQAGSSTENDPNANNTEGFQEALRDSAVSFNSIKGNIANASSIIEESFVSAGLGSNIIGAMTSQIPVAEAALLQSRKNLQGYLDAIRANLAFDRLQEMRDKSKTGGALGNVSNIELKLLESTVNSLDANLDREILLQNLQKVEMHYQNIMNSVMGLPVEIDFSDPAYQGSVQQMDGVIYVKNDKGEWTKPAKQDSFVIKNL
jgi:hypothetical protein